MDAGRLGGSTSLQENAQFQSNTPQMRSSTIQRLPLQPFNIPFQLAHPSTSTFQEFADIASTEKVSSAFRRVLRSYNERESSALSETYRLMGQLAQRSSRNAFRKRQQAQKRPKLCWRAERGTLRPSMNCPPDCKFHRMNVNAVCSRIKYDPNFQSYTEAFLKFREKSSRRFPQRRRPRSKVDDLNRLLDNSHIDERREVGFQEMMDKMDSFVFQDQESHDK